jgi:hypothetical protein
MKYFNKDEFACACCGKVEIDELLATMLDGAREIAGVPFVITSGYRCEKHNAEVGGKVGSSHVKGMAVDIATPDSATRYAVLDGLLGAGFSRIGIGGGFIHADVDTDKEPDVVWTYYKK